MKTGTKVRVKIEIKPGTKIEIEPGTNYKSSNQAQFPSNSFNFIFVSNSIRVPIQ